jgi:hypothetical protein
MRFPAMAMEERRSSPRARMLRGGRILLHHRSSVISCTVRNLSATGACLQVASVAGIPATFELAIDGETAYRDCRVVWETEARVGVVFGDAPVALAPPHPATRRATAIRRP